MSERERIEARLRAYIRPNEASTADELSALDRAVDAQLAYERESGAEGLPPGVESLRIGNYSVQASEPGGAALTRSSICPAAWAILVNAGLLRRTWPVAQRL